MPRFFDQTDDRIGLSIGSIGTLTALTIAAIVRLNNEANSIKAIWGAGTSVNPRIVMQISGTELLSLNVNGTARTSTTTILINDGWVFAAVTKAAGTSTGRAHIQKYAAGGAMVHENLSGTSVDPGGTPSAAQIGAANTTTPANFYAGDIAIVGVYAAALTDVQLEAMAYSLPQWWQVAPSGLWVLDQADVGTSVEDMSGGGAHQSAITGTTVTTNGPAIWNRGDPIILVERKYAAATIATADVAAATASAVSASDAIAASAGQATVAAAGLAATVQTAKTVDAGQAQVTAAALGITGAVVGNLGIAQVAAAGLAASDAIVTNAGQATALAVGLDATASGATSTTAVADVAAVTAAGVGATASVDASLATATAIATGLGASSSVAATSGLAQASGTALGASVAVDATSSTATAIATALDATVSAGAETTATADVAAASATAPAPSIAIAVEASHAASVAAAHQLAALLQAGAGQAQATATAHDATVAVSGDLTVQADTAAAIATAHDATVQTAGASVDGGYRRRPLMPVIVDEEAEEAIVIAAVLRDVQPFG